VQVEVVAAAAVHGPLHAQVGVSGRRQQRGELPGSAAERRKARPRHLAPERHARVEGIGWEVKENGKPPKRHVI